MTKPKVQVVSQMQFRNRNLRCRLASFGRSSKVEVGSTKKLTYIHYSHTMVQ